MFELRDFYYLNEKIVKGYVSTIEKGLIKETQESFDSSSPNWEFEIGTGELQSMLANAFGIPIPKSKVSRKGKNTSVSISNTKETTINFEFDKLMDYLEPVTEELEELSIEKWGDLKEGQFLNFPTTIQLPKGYSEVEAIKKVEPIQKMAQLFGKDDLFNDDELNKMKQYSELSEATDRTNVFFIPTNSPNINRHKFFGELIHQYSEYENLVPFASSKYQVFARIENILSESDKYTMYDVTHSGAIDMMGRKEKRKMKQKIDIATKPNIKIVPISIYKSN